MKTLSFPRQDKPSLLEKAVCGTSIWLGAIVLCGLFLCSLVFLCYFAPPSYPEDILFRVDNIPLTLVVLALALFLCALIQKKRLWQRITLPHLQRLLFFWVLLLGTGWLLLSRTGMAFEPIAVSDNALEIMDGNFATLQNNGYLGKFPHQLGFALYLEGVYTLFGRENWLAAQLLNVLFLALTYHFIAKLGRLLFPGDKPFLFLLLLLFGSTAPVLYTSYVYGILPGMLFATIAMWAAVRMWQQPSFFHLTACVGASFLAVGMKSNYLIVVIAIAVVWLVQVWKTRGKLLLAGLLLLLVYGFGAQPFIQDIYAARTGGQYRPGGETPAVVWVAMGLQEGPHAPGWYNGYTYELHGETGFNKAATAEAASQSISASLQGFAQNPAHALYFFGKKIASQWNEPTYGAFVFSERFATAPRSQLGTRLFSVGILNTLLQFEMGAIQMLSYFGAAVALIALRKKWQAPALLPVIVLLGGFLFHLVWEGKSQYILQYGLWCTLIAAPGFAHLAEKLEPLLARLPFPSKK